MEKKYLNESRYKKSATRKRRDVSTIKKRIATSSKKNIDVANTPNKVVKTKKKKTTVRKKSIKQQKINNIVTCIILLIVIAIISRAILKDENEPFIPLPFFEESNEEIIRIGVITEDSLLNSNSKNILICELNKYFNDMLLEVNPDYSITYKCLAGVKKISNSEYVLTRNEESEVDIDKIKDCLEEYSKNKQSAYYEKLNKIESITILDENTLNIKLKEDNPYFIFNLDVYLNTSQDLTNYTKDKSSTENKLVLNRHKRASKSLPIKIIVRKYKDMYAAVEAYKNKEINIFSANENNVINILGKTEYNIKTYRNGQTVFLLSNPNSKLYARQEVRSVIAYSIDRDSIIKEVLKSKGDKIDLPYIYDIVKYKYDVYAAENLLLSSGYKKNNKVYSKTEKGVKTTLELDLIVNKQDETKVAIANKIKNNLSSIGIKVNVEKLTESKLKSRVKNGSYDLILAGVNLNNSPNISFMQDSLYITDNVKSATQRINDSLIPDLNSNINKLQNTLSQDISAIGIYSDVSYLVYSKEVVGIDEISYMNLFKGMLAN